MYPTDCLFFCRAFIENPDSVVEKIDLFDNGIFADTRANDGIYSRYVTGNIGVGRYTVKCEAWDEGSAYVDDGSVSRFKRQAVDDRGMLTGRFNRVSDGGSFKVEKAVSAGQVYPPGRVTDLMITVVNATDTSITVRWTAPGSQLDSGTGTTLPKSRSISRVQYNTVLLVRLLVSRYQIKYSSIFDQLTDDNFHSTANSTDLGQSNVLTGNLEHPLAAGTEQLIRFSLANVLVDATTYFLALRAVNHANRTSNVSNIVSFRFAKAATDEFQLAVWQIVLIVLGVVALVAAIVLCVAAGKGMICKKRTPSKTAAGEESVSETLMTRQ